MKIATHNSGTGEKGRSLLSFLSIPFSKCQTKSIIEQWESGVRLFDFRVRSKNDKYVFAHGLWESASYVEDVLKELNNYTAFHNGPSTYVMVTYEGELEDISLFVRQVNSWFEQLSGIVLTEISVKKPKWRTLVRYSKVTYERHFKVLDFSSWHTYIPIPWLWKKIYYNKVLFNSKMFRMVDFI